jgi:hypothetical protein
VFAFFILIVIFRTIRNYRGIEVSPARTIGYTIFYFAFGAFLVAPSFFEGVSLFYAVPDIALLIVAAWASYKFADRRISFWKTESGSIYCKGGIIIYLIYLIGLVARLAVDYFVIGSSAFSLGSGTTILTNNSLIGAIAADLVIMFGIGLLIGRNLRIYKRYQRIVQEKENVASSPQKYRQI